MTNTIAKFVEQLKKRLKDNQGNYVEHNSWNRDTEGGFYDKDEFDFYALLKEIDTFSEEFKSNTETPNAEFRRGEALACNAWLWLGLAPGKGSK